MALIVTCLCDEQNSSDWDIKQHIYIHIITCMYSLIQSTNYQLLNYKFKAFCPNILQCNSYYNTVFFFISLLKY